ncbi:alanine racemase [Alicyclobacillus macrosporangiidus]|uniref:Predicted amino acid racemase n=1 Tax=Alicyclobacillus macrosporangiidus TaxID=392015 RepID=A0A1I7L956_9BACL|nr:alanine racemase [Alicyclobacillus macrosporangiidus]SFV06241.1 Predicted amino acid racemase [Alicyclobacillus macrosporangiidus]
MFLSQLLSRNAAFVDAVLGLYRSGRIPPNTYALDVDQIQTNAAAVVKAAADSGMSLYFMTKQVGRNPVACQAIVDAGLRKAVAVDPLEALTLGRHGVVLGHVGHLVQIPRYYLEPILRLQPEVVTVFSVDAAREVSRAASALGREQKLLLRVVQPGDHLYDAQEGGIRLADLEAAVRVILQLPNVRIAGVTSFPCVIVQDGRPTLTQNLTTLNKAAERLRDLGIPVEQVNAPGATCVWTLPFLKAAGATHGEPGHALTGTTPLHAEPGQVEVPSYLYITEVSHQSDGCSYVYGGGYYARGHLREALVCTSAGAAQRVKVMPPRPESIDYYLKIEGRFPVGTPVVMAFRTQMFVTRALVAPVTGVHQGRVNVAGIYTVEGKRVG